MTEKEQAKKSFHAKLEATALFTGIRTYSNTDRWWYFREIRKAGQPVHFVQNISDFRASIYWDYIMGGIECQVFLEREAHIGRIGENLWNLSFSGIEGKLNAITIQEQLKGLQEQGFYIPNGNENLERQMNFSLGLYGACLMHVDIKFPTHLKPLESALMVLDTIDSANERLTNAMNKSLTQIITEKKANLTSDEDENPDIIMGDWQTWK